MRHIPHDSRSAHQYHPKRISSSLLAWVFTCLLFVGIPAALAQLTGVSGHVVDSDGRAIVDAQVDLTHSATREVMKTRTNGDGYFQFPPVAPGTYTAHAHAPGFALYTLDHVVLEVGTRRPLDMTLSPGGQAQSVEVTASAPELVTSEPDRGNVIESKFTQNIPLNIRNPLQLVNFAAGVTALNPDSGNNDTSEAYTNTFQINGAKIATTESLLDGGANTTRYDFNAVAAVPQVDSIPEFKVISIAYAPEWGRTSGAVVTFATKAGTEQLHGSMYDYVRNSATDANSFNADSTGTPKPHFQRNQFGFALGGPAAFPAHFRDASHRTFFYVTYEGLRQSQATNAFYTVPSSLERNGDFSHSFNSDGKPIILYNPSSSMLQPAGSVNPPCTTTVVPANSAVYCRTSYLTETGANKISGALNPAGRAIIGSYPMPNTTGVNGSDVNDYYSNAPQSSDQNTVNSRLDHRFNDKHSIYLHFDWFQRFNNYGDPYRNGLSPVSGNQRLPGDNLMLDHTWAISSNLVFDHHFLRAHQESNRIPPSLGFNPTSIGFNSNVVNGLPTTTFPYVSSATGISSIGPTGGNEHDGGTVYEYGASLSQLRGKHSLKYGIDYRFLSFDTDVNQLVTITATNHFTSGPNVTNVTQEPDAGSGIADLLLGTGQVTSGIVPGVRVTHPYWAFFAQDEHHILPSLTLTYGLRYNIELPDSEAHNELQYLHLTSPSPLNASVKSLGTLTGGPAFVGTGGIGSRLQTTQFSSFDPRLGFAYQANQKTVVRGGFGIFHHPAMIVLGSAASQGYSAVTTSTATINGALPLYNMDNPFPSGLVQPSGSSLGLTTNAGFSITGYPRAQSVSYTEEWSLDIQRQLPYGFVLAAGYVGNRGLHLYSPVNYNQLPDSELARGSTLNAQVANPFYGVIANQASTLSHSTLANYQLLLPHPQFTTVNADFQSGGASNYNALQVTLEHRFAQGFSLLFNYTHSKMMDDVGNYLDFSQGVGYQDNYCPRCDWSASEQDLRDVMRLAFEDQLPFGSHQAHLQHGLPAYLFGNWSLGGFFTYDNGLPQSLTESTSTSSTANTPNVFGGGRIQPNSTGVPTAVPGGRNVVHKATTISEYFNPAAFVAAAPYSFGNASRYQSSIRLPGTLDLDTLVERAIPIRKQLALNFRIELFNTLNHVQLSGLNTKLGTANFGYLTPTQYNNPRSMQYSLRLNF
jgi:hypothetical protein